jgi:2-dehydropantoate 2-reductase
VHVSVVGAEALGCVYGARLATRCGVDVSLVARAAGEAHEVRIEHGENGELVAWTAAPLERVPAHADVAIVCVRYEQLDDALVEGLGAASEAPVVFLTPLLPQDLEGMRAALPGRVVPAMPGVAAYVRDDGVLRYWTPRVAATLVEEVQPMPAAVRELVRTLDAARLPARLEIGVHELNPATTISFAPLAMALDVAGGIDALLDDGELLSLALAAAGEGRELARTVGKIAGWASMLLRFVGPLTLKVGVGVARSRAPEAVQFVEQHFGRKLHAQNLILAERVVELAREKGTACESIAELLARLRAR